MVAADVAADELVDFRFHQFLRGVQPLLQPDRVALRLEPAQELGLERFESLEFPRVETVHEFRRHALRPAHEHVVEEVLHLAGNRIPANPGDGAGARLGVALRVAFRVRLGVEVVIPAEAAVLRKGHGVVGPERDVHAGELPEVGELLQLRRREPERVKPLVERRPGGAQVELERQQRFRGQHAVSGFGPVLQVRAAERAGFRGDLVFEQHHRPAPGAAGLARAAGDGLAVAAGDLVQVFLEVALHDGDVGLRLHLRRVPAVGAGEGTGAGVELDLRPAPRAREQLPARRGLGDGRLLLDRGHAGRRDRIGHCGFLANGRCMPAGGLPLG